MSLNAVDSLDALLSDVNKGRLREVKPSPRATDHANLALSRSLGHCPVPFLHFMHHWSWMLLLRFLRQAVSYLSLPPNVLQDLYSQAGTASASASLSTCRFEGGAGTR